ncbi:rac GTPase activating protein [Reticulomyxa filosa]|uniref:Rac GTPase activating protein n=1 Tax=Reticulomyxa filosa TaxID=46433 RepID=X6M7H9_RETFI|nr:rac GTPase activating protein [Reticulomyxa filosa]|eukprot:ETO09392.1 rac GTPase activating protein [Reticulomyxa filosa]
MELRIERELRRQVGCQFGVPIERIRGTIKFPDYSSRIPQLLVRLKDCLKAKDGLRQEGIFRLQPDGKKFDIARKRLDANVFDNDMDHNCVANAIKVWFRELPIKVLHSMPMDQMEKISATTTTSQQIVDILDKFVREPYKSILEWLLDLVVEVYEHKDINRMDAKNMAVVLSPNLYDTSHISSAQAIVISQSLLKFTEAVIRWRIEFRKNGPCVPPMTANGNNNDADDDDDDDDDDDNDDDNENDNEEEEEDDDDEEDEDDTNADAEAKTEENGQKKGDENKSNEITKAKVSPKEKEKEKDFKKSEITPQKIEINGLTVKPQQSQTKLTSSPTNSGDEQDKDKESFTLPLTMGKTNVGKMENVSGFVSNFKKVRSGSRADIPDLLVKSQSQPTHRKKPPAPSFPRKGTGVMDLGVILNAPPSLVDDDKNDENATVPPPLTSSTSVNIPSTASSRQKNVYRSHSQTLDEDDADSDEDTNNKRPSSLFVFLLAYMNITHLGGKKINSSVVTIETQRKSKQQNNGANELIPEDEEVEDAVNNLLFSSNTYEINNTLASMRYFVFEVKYIQTKFLCTDRLTR